MAGDPGYAITSFILKFIIGLVCGAVAHKAVSYTHLDVYKRQGQCRLQMQRTLGGRGDKRQVDIRLFRAGKFFFSFFGFFPPALHRHAVYTLSDPRAQILKTHAKSLEMCIRDRCTAVTFLRPFFWA